MFDLSARKQDGAVAAYLKAIAQRERRAEAQRLTRLVQAETGLSPTLWGGQVIGFGMVRYQYESGRSGDCPMIGLSVRGAEFVIDFPPGYPGCAPRFAALGDHRLGKASLSFQSLEAVRAPALQAVIAHAVAWAGEAYGKV